MPYTCKHMEDFRVLVLVLASDTDPVYRDFESAWRIASHPRADILFLKAHPNAREDFLHKDTVVIACEETLDTVYRKQMRAFRLLLPRLSQYRYVFRTNLSSCLDISLYLKFCEQLPQTNVYSGVVGFDQDVRFASGAGFTITPDLIERLVREDPPEVLVDDVSIGTAIASWGISVLPAPRIDYVFEHGECFAHLSPIPCEPFHYRVKTSDRVRDAATVRDLFESITRKTAQPDPGKSLAFHLRMT